MLFLSPSLILSLLQCLAAHGPHLVTDEFVRGTRQLLLPRTGLGELNVTLAPAPATQVTGLGTPAPGTGTPRSQSVPSQPVPPQPVPPQSVPCQPVLCDSPPHQFLQVTGQGQQHPSTSPEEGLPKIRGGSNAQPGKPSPCPALSNMGSSESRELEMLRGFWSANFRNLLLCPFHRPELWETQSRSFELAAELNKNLHMIWALLILMRLGFSFN